MKGRVAVCKEYNTPFVIEEYEVPDLEPQAILLQMKQSGICGSDLHVWRGDQIHTPLPPSGRVMGHEGYGIIHSLGKGVNSDSLGEKIQEGSRVLYTAIFPCNRCHMCVKGNPNFCINRPYPAAGVYPYFTGSYADYLYLPPGHPVFLAPDDISDEILAPANCAIGTVTQGLISAGARQGHSIVIQGAGGLGLMATAIAKDMGADQVIVIDQIDSRLELAKEFGADHTVNILQWDTPESRIRRIRSLTKDRGADIVLELVGRADLLPEGIAMLDNGGAFVEIGNIIAGGTVAFDPSTLLKGKRIIGSLMYPPHLLPSILDFLQRTQSTLPFHKLVSHKYKLADINDAFLKAEWYAKATDVTRAVLVP